MSSTIFDAMLLSNLINNNSGYENRRSRYRDTGPVEDFIKAMDRMNRSAEVKERKEKEKKDKKPETPKITYLEGVFWLFLLSPVVGPLFFHLEKFIYNIPH